MTDQMAARWRPLCLAVLLAALLLRLVAAVAVERHVQQAGRSFLIEGDANGYWMLAQRLAAGEDYAIYTPPRQVLRVPGFPLLLAASIRMFGDSVLAARIVLAVVGTACCGLTWLLGKRLVMSRVGFWATFFVAVNPLQIGNSVLILSETWFTFWMLLSLLAFSYLVDPDPVKQDQAEDRAADKPAPVRRGAVPWGLLAGALVGIASLVRPGFLPWAGICVLALLLLQPRRANSRLLIAGSFVVGCGLALLPWTVRNYQVTGHVVVTSLWSGPSLYDGLNPQATGGSDMRFFDDENVLGQMTEFEMNQHYQQRAVEFARTHPLRTAELAVAKAARYLSPVPNMLASKKAVWAICIAGYLIFLALMLAGAWAGMLDKAGWLVVAGPFLLFLLVHMVFVGSVRYRLPVEFPLSVLAAIGCRWLLTRRTASGR